MKIVTVLKTGGDFEPDHVIRLWQQCEQFAPGVEFVCLTDAPLDDVPGGRKLRHGWPKWWSKIEAFTEAPPCLYIDLDTVIVDDLAPLLEVAGRVPFTVLRDFNPHQRDMGSGLMAWSGEIDLSRLYVAFKAVPTFHMERHTSPRWYGDQGFVEAQTDKFGIARAYWQDHLPSAVVSYKKHVAGGTSIPDGARVICFHGTPRPWETNIYDDLASRTAPRRIEA